ncbi:MAG: Fibronectin type III domain protein [Parcubacteria group bacterium GW2011_GWF2_50_9]|nr:MAG: Fibronectin type III domain protein [Parcubacteria group bacterium GW2011_GWF2_50_9]
MISRKASINIWMLLIFCVLVIFSSKINAEPQRIEKKIDRIKLNDFSANQSNKFKLKKDRAIAAVKKNNLSLKTRTKNKGLRELMYFLPNGRPMFYETKNIDSAKTSGAYKLWEGGSSGLNLSGASMIIGEWDGGTVRISHTEFNTGRAIQKDGSVEANEDHGTHVAGTMIARGASANARGMSYSAKLWANDWNDDVSEMAAQAAQGLLISNHSYGPGIGWSYGDKGDNEWCWNGDTTVSSNEDYYFGFYYEDSQLWDSVAFLAPNYLIVSAAGNDGEEGPAA